MASATSSNQPGADAPARQRTGQAGGIFGHLWVRLLLAFAAVLLVAVIGPAVLARQASRAEFQHYANSAQDAQRNVLASVLAVNNLASGNWHDAQYTTVAWAEIYGQRAVVTDNSGTVVADSNGELVGRHFTGGGSWQSLPIDTNAIRTAPHDNDRRPLPIGGLRLPGGQVVPLPQNNATYGTLYINNPTAAAAERDSAFLLKLNRVTLLSAGTGLLAALALSLLLARRIGKPLELVTAAAVRMGKGDLDQRVPEDGGAEAAALARSFNTMAANLATSQRLRQQLVADVAHELRSPLANIRGYLEAIEDGVVPADEGTLRILTEEAAQLNHLIDDLQELAQAEAGVLRLDRGPVAPAELVERAVEAARPRAAEHGITLTASAPTDLPPVDVDAQRIMQVLQNLLNNALTHTPAHGRVTVSARQADDATVAFAVADTGAGISAEDLPYIFERFYRTDQSRARATGGSGLGLTIARRFVEAHGGTITATSRLGEGSTFTVTLPVVTQAHHPAGRQPAPAPAPLVVR